jgi:thymidylate synthase (FAD)
MKKIRCSVIRSRQSEAEANLKKVLKLLAMNSSVKFVWSTPNAEQMIGMMARVSNPENQHNPDVAKLLKYCIKHKHWSIFEMGNLCVEINTTRGISPQILRHRSYSFQEYSMRYSNTNKIGRIEVPHLRSQDYKNRQNSTDDLEEKIGEQKLAEFYRRIQEQFEDSEHLYQEMVSAGVAKECARFVLPLATPTRLYMNGTVRSWIHFIELRTGNGTQQEHKEIAESCKEIFKDKFPITSEALGWKVPESGSD